jgi:hypothetical protein
VTAYQALAFHLGDHVLQRAQCNQAKAAAPTLTRLHMLKPLLML